MATRYSTLHTSASLLDLQNWDETPRPSSSSSASTSSTSRSVTPTQSSRSSWSPQSPQTVRSPQPSNPWHASIAAKRQSPGGSPESRTPQYPSRSTTPVAAPQPLRPTNVIAGLNQSAYNVSNTEAIRGIEYPTSPTPSQYRQSAIQIDVPYLKTIQITRHIAEKYLQYYPSMLVRSGVPPESKINAYNWACRNPLVALLFVMCDDVAALPRAYFYALSDEQLPFQQEDFERIAAEPRKVVNMQWRVMVQKLPRNGKHIDFTRRECAPLLRHSTINNNNSSVSSKSVDRVYWLGENDRSVYVRKSYASSSAQQQDSIVKQIQAYKRLDHANLANILCSYTERSTVAFITTSAQYHLEEYLLLTNQYDNTRPRQLLGWINDLTQAVAFIHSQPRKPAHGSIRPEKILVSGSRVYLSVFGIVPDPSSSNVLLGSSDSSYLYSAPEIFTTGKLTRSAERMADVFSLGCVFLCMLTVIRGRLLQEFHTYRFNGGSDFSFHNNLQRVKLWQTKLRPSANSHEISALNFIDLMIRKEPHSRTKIRELAQPIREWDEERRLTKRRSLDDMDVNFDRRSLSTRMTNMQFSQQPQWQGRDMNMRRAFTTT